MDYTPASETPQETETRLARWEAVRLSPSAQRAANEIARRQQSVMTQAEAEFLLDIARGVDAQVNDKLQGGH